MSCSRWLVAGVLATMSLSVLAEIGPEDGQKFEPYAISAGTIDTLATACLGPDADQAKTVLAASRKLEATLNRFGMPKAAYAEDYQLGKAHIEVALANAEAGALCTEPVLTTLEGWEAAVTKTVDHLVDVGSP